MNPFEMVIGIVLIVTIGRVAREIFRSRDVSRIDQAQESGEARRLRDEVTMLKDRIAVLERLATDDTSAARIDREIEKLRDRS